MVRNILYMMILYSFFSCGKERDQNFIRVSKVNPCYLEYSDGTPFIPGRMLPFLSVFRSAASNVR